MAWQDIFAVDLEKYCVAERRRTSMGRLETALSRDLGYNPSAKREFKLAALQALRNLAKNQGLKRGEYDIRWNEAGVAVSGEATLHHEKFYLQVEQSCVGTGHRVLLRTCEGRKDYCGGQNQWVPAAHLDEPGLLFEQIERMIYR